LLSNNLDTIGHSEVCHLQDRALEQQLFELIKNLASLQSIAQDSLETEDLSLRQAPGMIVALPFPLFTPDFSDAPFPCKDAGVVTRGQREGNWLTRNHAEKILAAPDTTTEKQS